MKLNYKNLLQRRSDGLKLGQIVAKDLRKQTMHCFAKTVPQPELSPLVLDLPSKRLTDGGCEAMVEGLVETLESRQGFSANKLEELHLSGNELTTASLRALAPVIQLSRFDLTDLDLSDNEIAVKTDKEADDWQVFLESLGECRVLRRIDLSRNDLSGPRAFEILAKVYANQPQVDPTVLMELNRDDAGHEAEMDNGGDLAELTNRTRAMSVTSLPDDPPSSMEASMSNATVLKRRQGLRAVPYIILNDSNMTDSGALYFSYVLEKHYYPQHLMCALRSGSQATQLDEYNQKNHCWGIVYLPNKKLTSNGKQLLKEAEYIRAEFTGIEDDASDTQLNDSLSSQEDFEFVRATQASSGQRRSSNASSLRRRADTDPNKRRPVTLSAENYRKKIQKSMLEELGYNSVDLWRCAIVMLAYARVMLGHEQEDSPLPIVGRMDPVIRTARSRLYASCITATPAAPGEPVLAVTEVSNNASDLQIEDWLQADLPGQLTEDIWREILVDAVGGQGIMSEDQQKAVIRYARDRATREMEKSDLGKPVPVQIWWILERMGCLAYDIKA